MKQEGLEEFLRDAQSRGPYKVPADWAWVKLGELVEVSYGKGLPKNERSPDGRFWAYGSNGPIYRTDRYLVDPPVLIVGRKGSVGSVHFVDEKCWPIDTTYYLKANEPELDLWFLFWYLRTVDFSRIAITTTKPGLNRDDLRSVPVPLPPLAEQERIAGKIDELFNKIDKVEKLKKEALKSLDKLRKSILYGAFSGEI